MAVHVISIGISQYANTSNNLDFPADDASLISDILRHSIKSDLKYDILLRDSEATQIAIRTAFKSEDLKAANSDDTFIFFYSGHGASLENDDGSFEAVLVPFDVNRDLSVSTLTTSEIVNYVDALKHGKKILLLDCCYSGGASAKSISDIKAKASVHIKSFQTETFANGTVVFTACKSDEKAYEFQELSHGLFTYCLVEKLTADTKKSVIAVTDILHDVISDVTARSNKKGKIQTPTLKLFSEGSITLPAMKKPPIIELERIKVPTNTITTTPVLNILRTDIAPDEQQSLLENTFQMIQQASANKLNLLNFKSTVRQLISSGEKEYNAFPASSISMNQLYDFVSKLEAECTQLFLTSAAVALVADDTVANQFIEEVLAITDWSYGKSGLVAVIETNDVIFLIIMYIFAITAIITSDYSMFTSFMKSSVVNRRKDAAFKKVYSMDNIHYADSLGGNAKDVFKHIKEFFENQEWLIEMLGTNKEQIVNLTLQANLLLCVTHSNFGEQVYNSYSDYDAARLMSFVNKVVNDTGTKTSLSLLLDTTPEMVNNAFRDAVKSLSDADRGFSKYNALSYTVFDN